MENLGIFYVHLEDLRAFWYILWPFGTFCGYLVYFSPFWYVLQSGKPGFMYIRYLNVLSLGMLVRGSLSLLRNIFLIHRISEYKQKRRYLPFKTIY
jgi:hypothetical protein